MTYIKQVVETCACGASIRIITEYGLESMLNKFHEQHKHCFQSQITHVLTLPVGDEI